METLMQQEGSLGIIILLIALLVGLLYLLMPFFIWRIWYWSQQNNKHLKQMSTNLELLIREIAPEALPPVETPEEKTEEPAEEAAQGEDDQEDDLFSEESMAGVLADDDSMDFSMADEFEDVSDELSDSEISDFTDEPPEAAGAAGLPEDAEAPAEDDDEDELVMDFDDGPEESEDDVAEQEDIFAEREDTAAAGEEPVSEGAPSDFAFSREEPPATSEIPVSDEDSSDFTVEHFESNEEKSFEFEDVDDDAFTGPNDTFPAEETAPAAESSTIPENEDSAWSEPSTDDIWGEEAAKAPAAESEKEDFTFGQENDFGSAFDEPAKTEESVSDTANSFLSDLEDKLNLDSFTEQPAEPPRPAPEPAPTPEPEPEPKPKPETESQGTLFARCEGCGHKLAYKQALSGKRVRCPSCRTAFALP